MWQLVFIGSTSRRPCVVPATFIPLVKLSEHLAVDAINHKSRVPAFASRSYAFGVGHGTQSAPQNIRLVNTVEQISNLLRIEQSMIDRALRKRSRSTDERPARWDARHARAGIIGPAIIILSTVAGRRAGKTDSASAFDERRLDFAASLLRPKFDVFP